MGKSFNLNGREIAYTVQTEFLVQVSIGRKPYRTLHRIVGEIERAVVLYKRIKEQPGRKKRLFMRGCKTAYPTLMEHNGK